MKSAFDTSLVGPYTSEDANRILVYRITGGQLNHDYGNTAKLDKRHINDLLEFTEICRDLLKLPIKNEAFSYDEVSTRMLAAFGKIAAIAKQEIEKSPDNKQLYVERARALYAIGDIEYFKAYEEACRKIDEPKKQAELRLEYGFAAETFKRGDYGLLMVNNSDLETAILQYYKALDISVELNDMKLLNEALDGLARTMLEEPIIPKPEFGKEKE